jgi:uncharacterized protein
MSDGRKLEVGTIGWIDLTVTDAVGVRDFYREVVGWKVEPVDMGGYEDFTMTTPDTGQAMTGVCHARDLNADLPPVWLIYITVKNLEESLEQVKRLGGRQRSDIRIAGPSGRFCVIEDPAGVLSALFQPGLLPEHLEAKT